MAETNDYANTLPGAILYALDCWEALDRRMQHTHQEDRGVSLIDRRNAYGDMLFQMTGRRLVGEWRQFVLDSGWRR